MNLYDLLNAHELASMLSEGYIRRQTHPDYPYSIFNYTEKAAFANEWNDSTLTCRGLIVSDVSSEVIARPFKKFFNYGQTGAPALDLSAPAVVTDKADGSLGIVYPVPGGNDYEVATRGSFASDQAVHATKIWRERYAGYVDVPDGITLLVEIVYPENRIVLDYGVTDDLILLGAVDIETGKSFNPTEAADLCGWAGIITETFPYGTLAEALAAPPRANAEGLVVHDIRANDRVKLKQLDYVALHRIVTGLNARTVWQHMAEGKPLADLVTPLPDEFGPWVYNVADDLMTQLEALCASIDTAFSGLMNNLPGGFTRKEFAILASKSPHRAALFMILDGRDYRPALWDQIKPAADWTPNPKGVAA